jgi:orotate phosphoribosyltransferase-like protein
MSDERLERIRKLRESGMTYRQIGEEEKLSHEQVRRILSNTPRAKYARQRAKLVEQWADLGQAAVVYGVSRRNMEVLCVAGAVPGAQQVGDTWMVYRGALKKKGEKQG